MNWHLPLRIEDLGSAAASYPTAPQCWGSTMQYSTARCITLTPGPPLTHTRTKHPSLPPSLRPLPPQTTLMVLRRRWRPCWEQQAACQHTQWLKQTQHSHQRWEGGVVVRGWSDGGDVLVAVTHKGCWGERGEVHQGCCLLLAPQDIAAWCTTGRPADDAVVWLF